MAIREHTSAICPVNPAAPVFFTLADGICRFEERAGNLCWDDLPTTEGRIISYEPAEEHPAIRLADSTAAAARHTLATAWHSLPGDCGRAWALFDAMEAALAAAFEALCDFEDLDEYGDALCALYKEAKRGRWRARLAAARAFRRAQRWDEWGGWSAA